MTEWLLQWIVKNEKSADDTLRRIAIGKLAGVTGIICNAILFFGKLAAGLLSGSVAILADAVNNLSDASSSIVTLLGFRLAQRPADKDHPFGHARYEYLSGLLVAILILIIGIELVQTSLKKILYPQKIDFSVLIFLILLASISIKLWMWKFFNSLGKRISSLSLEAIAVDSRNDVLSTAAVLIGCVVGEFFSIAIDGHIGMAVAGFILISAVRIIKEATSPLLGKQADQRLVEKIYALALSREEVLGVHDLLIHDYGPGKCFASLHLEMDAQKDILAVHTIVDEIENAVRKQLNVDMVIHCDPVILGDAQMDETKKCVEQIVWEIDNRLSLHDFRMEQKAEETKIFFDLVVPYDMKQSQKELKQQVDGALKDAGVCCTAEIRFDGKM